MLYVSLNGKRYSIPRVEKKLSFRFLPALAFEREGFDGQLKEANASQKKLGRLYHSQINSSYLAPSEVRWVSKKVGYGLFAQIDLQKGGYVGEYTGIVRKNDRRYTEPLNHYCYEYPAIDSLGRPYVIDATHGHLTRFINHSAVPNLKPVYSFVEGFYHLIFIALRAIEIGEQFSYNYGANYWYLRAPPESF